MSAFVVDTNVPVVANGRSEQADPDCVLACIDALASVVDGGIVVLDDAMLIISEYMNNLRLAGQPGLGDAFLKWVWNVQADPRHCERVRVTPRQGVEDDFEEFPRAPELEDFDRSDRKFVAVAVGSRYQPYVLNAVDSDWCALVNHFSAMGSGYGICVLTSHQIGHNRPGLRRCCGAAGNSWRLPGGRVRTGTTPESLWLIRRACRRKRP
jgi:hypothetical protein